MRKRIVVGDKDAAVVFLTRFHNDLQRRLKERQDEDRINHLSNKFAKDFNEVLLRCYGFDKVQAETVYMQCMLHKGCVHIGKTKWKTLDDFVKYQGRIGSFLVEYCSKIWYVQALPNTSTGTQLLPTRSPLCTSNIVSSNNFRLRFQQALKQLSQLDVTQTKSDTTECELSKNTERDKKSHDNCNSPDPNPTWTLKRSRVEFKMSPRVSPYSKDRSAIPKPQTTTSHAKKSNTHLRKSTLAEIMEEEEKAREMKNRKGHWLQPGIIVRIVSNKYGNRNNRKRCRVVGMLSMYTGLVHVLDTDDIFAADQKHLRTCTPEVGGVVRFVNGAYRDEKGVLEKFRPSNVVDSKCCVRITGSPLSGRLVKQVHCDDITEIYKD